MFWFPFLHRYSFFIFILFKPFSFLFLLRWLLYPRNLKRYCVYPNVKYKMSVVLLNAYNVHFNTIPSVNITLCRYWFSLVNPVKGTLFIRQQNSDTSTRSWNVEKPRNLGIEWKQLDRPSRYLFDNLFWKAFCGLLWFQQDFFWSGAKTKRSNSPLVV